MRKLFCLIAMLLLTALICTAGAEDLIVESGRREQNNLQLVSRNCFSPCDEAVIVLFELANRGNNIIHFDVSKSAVDFYDASGNVIHTETGLYPMPSWYIRPGQRTFIKCWILKDQNPEAFPAITQAADYRLRAELMNFDGKNADHFLPKIMKSDFTWEKRKSTWFERTFLSLGSHTYEFTGTITNDTGEDIDTYGAGFEYAAVLMDENGAPIYIDQSSTYFNESIMKLKAGETRKYHFEVNDAWGLFAFFEKYDFTISSAYVIVYKH